MDPVSIVGLAISAGSIAFQILGGCIQGFILISSAFEFGKDSATYVCMLNLNELQLVEWARRAGLLEKPPRLDPRLNEPVVCAVLRELQNLLLDTSKLKSRYRMTYSEEPTVSPGTQSRSESADQTTSFFKEAVSNDLRNDIMIRAGTIESNAKWPRRIWWSAVDKDKFKELIQTIRILETELWRLLDPLRQDDMSQSLQIVLSRVIGMTESLDSMQALQRALLQSKESGQNQVEGSALASVADLKLRSMQLSPNTATGEDRVNKVNSLDETADSGVDRAGETSEPFQSDNDINLITDFVPLKNNESIGTALFKDTPVLIEHKTLPSFSKTKLLQRAKDLALLLSAPKDASFRSLRCSALASDSTNTKLAFIFTLPTPLPNPNPTPHPPTPQLTSLRTLFSLTPSVTTRLHLALALVQSLRWFHAANWLHKDIRSEHILFPLLPAPPPTPNPTPTSPPASTSTPTPTPDLTHPLLAGFSFSRLAHPDSISEQPTPSWQADLYRHPSAMGEPTEAFTKDKDIYALATVLVEIGEWRSLKSLVAGAGLVDMRRYEVAPVELGRVKGWLQEKGVGGLGFRMGEVYRGVVGMMLGGVVPGGWRREEVGEGWRGGGGAGCGC